MMNNVKAVAWFSGIFLFLGCALSFAAMGQGSVALLAASVVCFGAGALGIYRLMKLTL